jgi:NADH:ubiquinone oxidoreductase subunit 4 (subunit M)
MVVHLHRLVISGLVSNKQRTKMVFLWVKKRLALYNWTYLSLVFLRVNKFMITPVHAYCPRSSLLGKETKNSIYIFVSQYTATYSLIGCGLKMFIDANKTFIC